MNLNNRSSIMNSNMLCFLLARALVVVAAAAAFFPLRLVLLLYYLTVCGMSSAGVAFFLSFSLSLFVSAPRHQLLSLIHRSKKTRQRTAIEYADDTSSSSRWPLSRFETNHFHLHTAMRAHSNKILLHLSPYI